MTIAGVNPGTLLRGGMPEFSMPSAYCVYKYHQYQKISRHVDKLRTFCSAGISTSYTHGTWFAVVQKIIGCRRTPLGQKFLELSTKWTPLTMGKFCSAMLSFKNLTDCSMSPCTIAQMFVNAVSWSTIAGIVVFWTTASVELACSISASCARSIDLALKSTDTALVICGKETRR